MFKENLAKEWEEKFWSLPTEELEKSEICCGSKQVQGFGFLKIFKKSERRPSILYDYTR